MNSENLIYEEIPPYSKEIALQELRSGDSKRAVRALLSLAFNDENWRGVQEICLENINKADENIRGIALLCFGHLARIHKQIDAEIIIPVLVSALDDESYFVRSHAKDALNDIEMFCKIDTTKFRTKSNT